MAMIRFAFGEVGSSRSSDATASAIESRFVAPRFALRDDTLAFLDVLRIMLRPGAATAPILTSGLTRVKQTETTVVGY